MKDKFHLIKPSEAVILGMILLAAIAAIIIMNRKSGAQTAVITCEGARYELPLDEDGTFRFDGIDADFEVKDGKIRVKNASCPDRICENTGFIGSSGQTIICVPNKISVTVEGAGSGVDVTVG